MLCVFTVPCANKHIQRSEGTAGADSQCASRTNPITKTLHPTGLSFNPMNPHVFHTSTNTWQQHRWRGFQVSKSHQLSGRQFMLGNVTDTLWWRHRPSLFIQVLCSGFWSISFDLFELPYEDVVNDRHSGLMMCLGGMGETVFHVRTKQKLQLNAHGRKRGNAATKATGQMLSFI